MYQYPCNGCKDRAVGCHGSCQKYQEAKAKHTQKTMEILNAKKVENGMDSYKIRVVMETKKKFDRRR